MLKADEARLERVQDGDVLKGVGQADDQRHHHHQEKQDQRRAQIEIWLQQHPKPPRPMPGLALRPGIHRQVRAGGPATYWAASHFCWASVR